MQDPRKEKRQIEHESLVLREKQLELIQEEKDYNFGKEWKCDQEGEETFTYRDTTCKSMVPDRRK